MRRFIGLLTLGCLALAGCEKPPLVRYPGDPPSSPGSAQNTPPIVDAGADVTLQWPNDTTQLSATATDDGLPSTDVRYSWVSEPNGVLFDDPMALVTNVRFPGPGTYTVTLTANDGAVQTSDSLIVTIASVASNAPPVVDAGADQTIEMPFAATLTGTASDDAVPAPTLSYTWSHSNGPGDATFENPAAANTTVSFSLEGTYELQLSVSDGELTATDTLIVTVNPAVYPAPDLTDADPDRGWMRVAPAAVGMDAALLVEAQNFALQAGGAGLISRRGRLVHSWDNIDRRYDLKSTTKSIGSIALGILIDEGWVAIEDRATTHLPAFGTPPLDNDPTQLQNITLLQLATHTAGFEKTGGFGDLIAAPGAAWRYSDGGLNWLADTLTTVYAGDLEQLFITRVYPVLGITRNDDIQWRPSSEGMRKDRPPTGLEHREFAAGITANVNSMARIGLLFLRRGEWENHQRVISPAFVDLVRTPRPELVNTPVVEPADFPEANLRYGVLWWTNATGALPNVPRDAYWAWGLYDSLIVVIPSLDLVIARAGPRLAAGPGQRVFGGDRWNAQYEVLAPFLDPIVRAVQP